jgi:hypothetical protein
VAWQHQTKKGNAVPKTRKSADPDPESQEYRDRYYATQPHVVRAYCDFFGFWRDCRYRRCRRARSCRGDHIECIEARRGAVADRFDAARAHVRARIPHDARGPERDVWNCDMCKARWFGDLKRESDRAERLARRQAAREERKNATLSAPAFAPPTMGAMAGTSCLIAMWLTASVVAAHVDGHSPWPLSRAAPTTCVTRGAV